MELVVADGMLSVPNLSIKHPILFQRVSLAFNASVPEFSFSTGTDKIEMYKALLRLVPEIDGRKIATLDQELDERPVEPLGGVSASGFLHRVIQGSFREGEYLEARPDAREVPEAPSLWRESMIFLLPRTAGLTSTLDYIVEDLGKDDVTIPDGLVRIVGVETNDAFPLSSGSGDSAASRTMGGPEPDILFSKPANQEQYEIAARLEMSNAVLVQGPPGTGKTHTIANLLGYLLQPCTAKTISMVYADGSMKKRQLISFLGLECQEIGQKCRVGFKRIRARCALRLAQFARLHPWLSPRRFGNLPNNKPATILP